uniref:Uncharacterized protein n=1 Tax=Nymphaea colorata TaxID=210225 RepID=A0A5K1B041_9MAGN
MPGFPWVGVFDPCWRR